MTDILRNDQTGDIVLANNDLKSVTGLDAVKQHLTMRLLTFRSEWFLDPTIGVPYFDAVLGQKNPRLSVLDSAFRPEIVKTPGVIRILKLDFDYKTSTRALTLILSVQAIDGVINFTLPIQAGI